MNAYSFINSGTIREHLEKINYEFTPWETAWLIYSCKRLSYEEKKSAWLELVSTTPDSEIPERTTCPGCDGLHAFLKRYIGIIDREIEEFYKEEPAGAYVYKYTYLYKGDGVWTEEYETSFPSLSSCIEAFKAEAADMDETYSPDKTGVIKYKIQKQSLTETDHICEIECFGDDWVIRIWNNQSIDSEDGMIVWDVFESLWFDFPTPFKKGDIVWVPKDEKSICWDCDGGFVLEGLSTWDTNSYIREYGDNSDMSGYGCFVNENGTVYHEVMSNYMDLEYYKGPYKSNERILPALSKYLKGEISIDFLLCAYRKILLDIASDDIMIRSWYPEEMIRGMGLK